MNRVHRAISVPLKVPQEIRRMLTDFKDMVNWVISWALNSPRTYDRNGRRVFDKYRICAATTIWFEARWRGRYAAHYHEAACSFACQQLTSWLAVGGNTSSLPYLTKPMARLRSDLARVELKGRELTIRVVLAPRHFVFLVGKANHGKLPEYEAGTLGEILLFDDKVNLVWRFEDRRVRAKKVCATDTNIDRIVVANEDGRIDEVSLKEVADIQRREREIRRQIQAKVRKNLAKQQRLLQRRSERERSRVRDLLHKKIVPDLLTKTAGYGIGFDDLRRTIRDCARSSSCRRFHERLSAWSHGAIQTIANERSALAPMRLIYTRGTSTWCPLCGTKLSHPKWKVSRCLGCALDFDRDRLSAVSGLVRMMIEHRKGEPWALAKDALRPEVAEALQRECVVTVLPQEDPETPEPTFEQGVQEVPVVASDGGLLQSASSSTGEGSASLASTSSRAGLKTAMTPMTRNDTKYESEVRVDKELCLRQPSSLVQIRGPGSSGSRPSGTLPA